jgi:hypothetical protein
MIKLQNALRAWNTPDFERALKHEIQELDANLLPLQAGLTQSSHVSEGKISVVVLNTEELAARIRAKVGVFYAGVIAGSCCADDPTPLSENTEYCELQFDIDKNTAEASVVIL